ncbi:MAG: DUF2851 family protein [Chloroflexota bacterium]|nr:DUF2851 family protein [Chloroflexota bacterium]
MSVLAPARPAPWRALAEEPAVYAPARGEAALAERWFAGLRAPSRVEDGRRLRIRFPGVPAPGYGPDARDAVIELDGAELCGDVEFHLRASGWHAHGHHDDPAYARVVLHVVEENDGAALVTPHASGRAIPLAVAPAPSTPPLPGFSPPCAATAARSSPVPALERLGLERLRAKTSRAANWAAARGPAPVLYALALETLAGRRNRESFAEVARRLPLPALLEAAPTGAGEARAEAFAAALKEAARDLPLVRHGGRPAAAPERRLDALGAFAAQLWPGARPDWPEALAEPASIPRSLRAPGIGAGAALELAVNAVLPAALGARLWPEEAALDRFRALPAPAPYGQLRSLSGWLSAAEDAPLARAAALQGALQLHARHCSRGGCGACPLS